MFKDKERMKLRSSFFAYTFTLCCVFLLHVIFSDNASALVTFSEGIDTFTITRQLNDCTDVVINNTFTYSISEPVPNDNPSGGVTGMPSSVSITLNNHRLTHYDLGDGLVFPGGDIELSYVIDFRQLINDGVMTITKPGDYYYTITESSSNSNLFPADDAPRTMMFSVRYAVVEGVEDTNNLVVTIIQSVEDSRYGQKVDAVWESDMVGGPILAVQYVRGNLASTDDCFTYRMRILPLEQGQEVGPGGIANDSVFLAGAFEDIDSGTVSSCPNSADYEDLTLLNPGRWVTFSIKHDEMFVVNAPIGVPYVIERVSSPSGYSNYLDGSDIQSVSKTTSVFNENGIDAMIESLVGDSNITIAVGEKRIDLIVDSGIFTNAGLYVILLAIISAYVIIVVTIIVLYKKANKDR